MTLKLRVLGFLLTGAFALLGQRTYDCGDLNQRTCKITDWERTNMRMGTDRRCDYDLEPVDGICRAKGRNLIPRNISWAQWALEDQLYRIGKDSPINFILWPASHNAYSSVLQGFESPLYTNHFYSIYDQLQLGVRHIELDPKFFAQPGYENAVRVCHASNTNFCTLPGYGNRLFGFVLREIANWLDANPGQILYIKLDDGELAGQQQLLYGEIERYLGHRVYPAPLAQNFGRWPTIQEIRNAGKQVILAMHNSIPSNTTWVWRAEGRVQASNYPLKQDFFQCKGDDGMTPATRSALFPLNWWDTAEGRAKWTNATGDTYTGMFWEDIVARAANCGVAVIGLDFLGALGNGLNVEQRESPPDRRLEAMVWSWKSGDRGEAGPAMLEGASGRWVSRPSSTVLPLACGKLFLPGSTRQDREWRISSSQIPWNRQLADARCAEEFGSEYAFVHPWNAWQNRQLKEVAAGSDVWLGYSLVREPRVSVTNNDFRFRMNPGGPLPEAQQLQMTTAPNASIIVGPLRGNAPITVQAPFGPIASGEATLSVSVAPAALSLPPGEYTASTDLRVEFGQRAEAVNLTFTLRVFALSNVSLSLDAPAREGEPASISVRVTGLNPTGGVTIHRLQQRNGVTSGYDLLLAGQLNRGLFREETRNLAPGTHLYVASYNGDAGNTPGETEPVAITNVPRISANPSATSFTMVRGGSVPAPGTVTITGLATNPAVQIANCDWARASLAGATLTLRLTDAVRNLEDGAYNCVASVRDDRTPAGFGSLEYPFTLYVQTTIAASPAQIERWAKPSVVSVDGAVTSLSDKGVPVTVTTNRPWLGASLRSDRTPAVLVVALDGTGLMPGTHTGTVTVNSPLAPAVNIPVTFTVVNPVTVTSQPLGRTVLVDGVATVTPAEFVWQPGTMHQVQAPTPQLVNGTRYSFLEWFRPGISNPTAVLPFQSDVNGGPLEARFRTEHQLSADVAPPLSGTVAVTPSSPDGFYAPGTLVQLQAAPAPQHTFVGWQGALAGVPNPRQLAMNGPRSVVAMFSRVQPVNVTITANAPGASVVVNGTTHPLPATLPWVPGESYTVQAPPTVPQSPGVQWQFASWSNGGGQTQTLVGPGAALSLAIQYDRHFLLTASSAPESGGTVSGGGWYREGTTVNVSATPNPGFAFTGFTGALTGPANPQAVVMSAARTVVANFGPSGEPVLAAASNLPRTDGPGAGQRTVPLQVRNLSAAVALQAQIASISGIQVVSGSGVVGLATPAPISLGDIGPNQLAAANVVFTWPATATRVRFTVNLTANGRPAGSTTLTLFR
ncbi:MAG: hypothetical protein SFV54_05915 [Bryobacteraceae bacterium]|nr:hypothetical protein [Bryobacteraceae bacterium]